MLANNPSSKGQGESFGPQQPVKATATQVMQDCLLTYFHFEDAIQSDICVDEYGDNKNTI